MNRPMERVSASQAAAMREQLSVWRDVQSVRSLLDKMAEPHGFYAVSQGNMQFWREAHCACDFATAQGADALRLCEGNRPDFELRIGGSVVPCELAELRDPVSRTGREYEVAADQHNRGEKLPVEPFEVDGHKLWLKERLEAAVSSKANKGYDPATVLAVYIHAWIFPDQWEQAARVIGEVTAPHAHVFSAIWVLGSGRLYSVSVKQGWRH